MFVKLPIDVYRDTKVHIAAMLVRHFLGRNKRWYPDLMHLVKSQLILEAGLSLAEIGYKHKRKTKGCIPSVSHK